MKIRELDVEGALEITPVRHTDPRGTFLEWFRGDELAAVTGREQRIAQANLSVSARGVTRGIHFADVPPGQAKYITCVRGAVYDVVVDLRTGSSTYGRWQGVVLDDTERRALFLAEGLGHGFCALTDDACVVYLCSETYAPRREHAVHPLDPDLAIAWPVSDPLLSARDAAAPSLAEAHARGLLPDYEACLRWISGTGRRSESA